MISHDALYMYYCYYSLQLVVDAAIEQLLSYWMKYALDINVRTQCVYMHACRNIGLVIKKVPGLIPSYTTLVLLREQETVPSLPNYVIVACQPPTQI